MKTFSIPEYHKAGRGWDCGHIQTACCRAHLDDECPVCSPEAA